jgi:hypothetical protein
VLLERFRNRVDRHPGHPDAELEQEVADRNARGDWEPLDLPGEVVRVDATTFPDAAGLAARLRASSTAPSH